MVMIYESTASDIEPSITKELFTRDIERPCGLTLLRDDHV